MASGPGQAVSPVIGFLLIVAILATLVAVLQTSAVPVWNAEVERDHGERVQGDVQRFGAAVTGVAADGSRAGVPVDLGVDYPNRVVLSNLPAATGSFSLVRGQATIDGARAVDPDAADYWNGSARSFDDAYAVYEPSYRYREPGPLTVADHGAVYNREPSGAAGVLRTPSLVDAGGVRLVTLRGSLGLTGSRTATLDLFPDSAVRNAVTVTNASDGPVTVTVPTRLEAAWWRDQLDDPRVVDVRDAGDGRVTVELARGERYRLALGAVGVNGRTVTPPRYIVGVVGDGARVGVGDPVELVAEVRDRFDNPVADASVRFAVDGDGTVQGGVVATVPSDADGRARVTYRPTGTGDATVNASLAAVDGPAGRTRFTVSGVAGATVGDAAPPEILDVAVTSREWSPGEGGGPPGQGPPGGGGAAESAHQVAVDYDARDGETGVATVTVTLNDTVETVTAGTATFDGAARVRSTWTSPYIRTDDLAGGDVGSYEATVRVVDGAGNEDVAVADVPSP